MDILPIVSSVLQCHTHSPLPVRLVCRHVQRKGTATYSLRIALTTALENGADVVVALIANRRAVDMNMQLSLEQLQGKHTRAAIPTQRANNPGLAAYEVRHRPGAPLLEPKPTLLYSAATSYQIRR